MRRRVAAGFIIVALTLAVVGTAAYIARPRNESPQVASAPSFPTNVHAVAGAGGITVSWDAVSDALVYHLYRASVPGVTKEGYAALPDGARHANVVSPYTISNLAEGKTYYFRVTAANEAGESSVSGEVSSSLVSQAVPISPPANVVAVSGDGRVTVSWDPVAGATGYHLYRASVTGITKEAYATLPDGARYNDVLAPYTIAALENGKTYYFRVTAEDSTGESRVSGEVSATPLDPSSPTNLYVTGLVELDSGAPASGASVTLQVEGGTGTAAGQTGPDGRFNVGLTASFPDRVLAKVTYRGAVGPSATGFRWSPPLDRGGAVDVGRILLPAAADKRMTVVGGSAWSADGAIAAEDLPSNVVSLWARSYDPDAIPDMFPGSLAEGRTLPLNSVAFLWISALDGSGMPVVNLGAPATVRMRVPATQWVDLADLDAGNGVIDIPIYSLDYATGYWVRDRNGLLTDSIGTPLREDDSPSIRAGTYSGQVYAEFLADHFSWWNVDYPPANCKPDFGDASDPPYPTALAHDGARHLNICRAWLGAWVDGEQDANQEDVYDDGLRGSNPLKVRVSNFNWSGYLYLNALIDANADGDWSDAGEWAIQNLPLSVPRWTGKIIETNVVWGGTTWLRLTLTGAAITNYDGTGEFAIGETEDYPFLKYRLYVGVLGDGKVTSDPPGIDCRPTGSICAAEFLVGTVVRLTATPDPAKQFTGWGLDCTGTSSVCDVRMDEDRAVLAKFGIPKFRLTLSVFGGGVVRSVPAGIDCRGANYSCAADFPAGTSVDLTGSPDPDWRFDRWQGDCAGVNPTCTLQMDRDRFVSANFTRASYWLSLWVVGNGTVTSTPPGIDCGSMTSLCSAAFATGSVVNLTAVPDPGESFITWGGDCSGSSATCTVVMDRDRYVFASFTSAYYLLSVAVYGYNQTGNQSYGGGTVTSQPPGINCQGGWNGSVGVCSAYFAAGTNVTLTATPDPGWQFAYWAGACSGTNPICTVTMNAAKWVAAYFTT